MQPATKPREGRRAFAPSTSRRRISRPAGAFKAGDVDASAPSRDGALSANPDRPGVRGFGTSSHGRRGSGRLSDGWRSGCGAGPSGLRRRLGGRNGFSGLQQPGDRLPDRHDIAHLRGDAAENAVGGGFDFDDGFVGFDFEQELALLDRFAVLFLPGDEFPGSSISIAAYALLANR